MKKLRKVFLSMALVLVMTLPMLTMTGCDLSDLFGGKDETKRVSSIALTKGIKTEYSIGDEIDFNGAKLLLRYEDDTEVEITLTTDLVSGFNTATFGNRTMKISYKGKEISVNYKVDFKLTDNKWCISFATNGQGLEQNFSKTNHTISSGYLVFGSNNKVVYYGYDEDLSKFTAGDELDYNFKTGSNTELEIKNLFSAGVDASLQIISGNEIKMVPSTFLNAYYILTRDYYDI